MCKRSGLNMQKEGHAIVSTVRKKGVDFAFTLFVI